MFSNALYRQLFEDNPQPMWVYDLETLRFLAVNDAAIVKYGYSRAEFLEMTLADIRPLEDVPRLLQNVAVVTEGLDEAGIWRHRLKDGTEIIVSITSHTTIFTGRRAELVIAQDVTDRKRAEAALAAEVRRTKAILNASFDGIVVLDHYRVVDANPRFAEMLGYSLEEVLTLSVPDWETQWTLEALDAQIAQWQTQGQGLPLRTFETRHRRRDGSTFEVEISINDVIWEGKILQVCICRDISERKRMEAERQQAEKLRSELDLLETILDVAGAGYWDWDIINHREYISPKFKQMFGYEDHELPNTPEVWKSLIFPEDLPIALSQFEQHVKSHGQIPYCTEVRYHHKNGSTLWVACSGRVIDWDAEGQPRRMIGCLIDITPRKQTEEQLRHLSDRLTLALQSGAIGMWEWDIVQDLRIWDDRMYELYGLQPSEGENLCQLWYQCIHPDDWMMIEQGLQQAVQGECDFEPEFRIIHPNGNQRILKAYGLVQYDKQGCPSRMIGINYDITDRKQVEEALRTSEQLYATLAEAAPVAIFRLDVAGLCTYVNHRWAEMMGRSRDYALGVGCFRTLHPEDQDRIVREWSEKFERGIGVGTGYQTECRHQLPNGKIIWTYIQVLPERNLENNLVGYVGSITDISDRKQAEQQLQHINEQLAYANTELAHATRLKDEFLANMSHELRTPLNAILGMSEVLQENRVGSLNERQQKMIATIEKSGRHLLELITDILDLSKVEAGDLNIEIIEVSIHSLCESCLSLVEPTAQEKQIQVNVHISPTLQSIWVDEKRIRQVLINLLNNAVKFTPTGGSIQFDAQIKKPGTLIQDRDGDLITADTPLVSLVISDTGIGIAPEHQKRLFKPFTQIDSRLNRQYEGTGLGLALSQRIAQLHHGWITLASQLGQGSCFTLWLPQPQLAHPIQPEGDRPILPEHPPSQSSLESRVPTLLLAEDHKDNQATMLAYLEGCGYQMLLAEDGIEAIAMTEMHQPDLILMDIQMPKMDGLDAIRHIRQNPEFAEVPIIALTALAMAGDREKCLEAGATEYLSKPVRLKKLVTIIQSLLAHAKVSSSS